MKLIYTHENRFLVGNAHNILEQAGIRVVWKNEFASGAIGELSAFDAWPELWVVDDADHPHAIAILTNILSTPNTPEWTCPQCDENNDAAFEVCWNCQAEK
jgi:hypothetical protein